jgi:tetratricopeptide (TPR) repeat protein
LRNGGAPARTKQDAAYRCGECKDHYRDALSLELLSARLQAVRADGQSIAFTLNTLANELQDQGKSDEAEPLFREVLEVSRETLGDRHRPAHARRHQQPIGIMLMDKGDLAAAEPLCREALERRRQTLGACAGCFF